MKRFWVTDWFLALVTGVALFVAAQASLTQDLERGAYDFGVRLTSRTPGADIVVIAIDDASLGSLGGWQVHGGEA